MRTTPPAELLTDHTGAPKPLLPMPLDYEQARLGIAFHEAGHAVLSMAYGMHVITSEVIAWEPTPGDWNITGNTAFHAESVHAWRFAAQAAAGEIANIQYLLAYGLWTPERAVACAADHDREQVIDTLSSYGYSIGRGHVPTGGKSWGQIRGMARRKVSHLWREIRTTAHAINDATVLTGDEIAAITKLTNPPWDGGAS
ncbi:hypothetical protein DY218_28650 [Streptomyces triticagri]|uniref:Peptidase M41 domain-containing protein n=1 Tax=Streptomyces triticagri TaxID=2293568 RepID=A0A372LX74_9ACTN|nr:hypothetical protein [Streptomyces triticagri]RFU83278.1 hypothetical protein DY218_28650 [Streptomyces triticagri]